MMDKNDTTADSLILIDWDMTQYGYRKCAEVFLAISGDVDFVITCVELENFNVNLANFGCAIFRHTSQPDWQRR